MISLTSAQIDAYMAAFLWPFFRILALLAVAPVLDNASIPNRVKLGLAVFITLLVAPLLPPLPPPDPWSATGLKVLAQQILIGTAMGFTMRIIFTIMEMAGELISMQIGLGFAMAFNPESNTTLSVLAQFYAMLTTLLFLAMDGHILMISTLVNSFHTLPISDTLPAVGLWREIASWGGHIFYGALMLSLPILATILVTNISMGILTRAAPQLNIFAVGIPLTLMVGLMVILLTLPNMLQLMGQKLLEGLQMMAKIAI